MPWVFTGCMGWFWGFLDCRSRLPRTIEHLFLWNRYDLVCLTGPKALGSFQVLASRYIILAVESSCVIVCGEIGQGDGAWKSMIAGHQVGIKMWHKSKTARTRESKMEHQEHLQSWKTLRKDLCSLYHGRDHEKGLAGLQEPSTLLEWAGVSFQLAGIPFVIRWADICDCRWIACLAPWDNDEWSGVTIQHLKDKCLCLIWPSFNPA